MSLAKVVGGVLLTIVGFGFFLQGGLMPAIFAATPVYMLLGFIIMVVGGYIVYKGHKDKIKDEDADGGLIGIDPQGRRYYK